MSIAYEQLVQHLEGHDIRFDAAVEDEAIRSSFRCRTGSYVLGARVDEQQELFEVFGMVPVTVPPGGRPAVAEAITRANYGLRVGKFEMDFSDGEIRFHTYSILGEDGLDESVIRRLIATTLAMLDRYVPAVLSVIYGNETPEDAIRCAEASLED